MAYVKVPRSVKSQILDQVVDITDWFRGNARRRLATKAIQPARQRQPKPGPTPGSRRYSSPTTCKNSGSN